MAGSDITTSPCGPGVAMIRDHDLAGFERSVLRIARHFFWTFDQPDSPCWMDAFMEAARSFPVPFGAMLS